MQQRPDLSVRVQFNTHQAHISIHRDQIWIFKYNGQCCDYATFSLDEEWAAADYLMNQLPHMHYRVTVPGDQLD